MHAILLFLSLLPAQPRGLCVLDEANALNVQQFTQLEGACEAMDKSGDGQFEVVVTNDFRGDEKEEFTNKLFTEWKIGHAGKNDGVLIVLSPQMRKWRIEVGYGLEGRITDLQAAHIGQQFGVPAWKRGDWGGGLVAVVDQIVPLMHAEAREAAPVTTPEHSHPSDGLIILLFLLFGAGIVGLIIYFLVREDHEKVNAPAPYRITPDRPVTAPYRVTTPAPVHATTVVAPVIETSRPSRRDDTPSDRHSTSSWSSSSSNDDYSGGGGFGGGGFDGGGGGMSGGGGAGGDF